MDKRNANARDEHNKWEVGGGGVEFDATIEQTLRQEIKEEYCADVVSFEFLGYRDVHREHNGKRTHWITLDFKVLIDPTMVANGEPHKFDAVQFFNKETLPPLAECHSQLSVFLEKYQDRLFV